MLKIPMTRGLALGDLYHPVLPRSFYCSVIIELHHLYGNILNGIDPDEKINIFLLFFLCSTSNL